LLERGRRTGSPWLRLGRRCLPVLISAGLVAWLVWRVSPGRLMEAAAVLNWPALVALTLGEMLALFLWDSVCLRWLFSLPEGSVSFDTAVRARAQSYRWTVVNYGLGQGVLAWDLARARGLPFASALGRCVLLALHDLAVLFGLALAASFVSPEPRPVLRRVCLVGLLVLAGLAVAVVVLPGHRRARLGQRVDWLAWWRWRHSLTVFGLRLAFFLIIVTYVTAALAVIGLPQGTRDVCGTVPLMLLAEAVPSISGFGTRDAAVLGVLHPAEEQRGLVLGFTLLWSSVLAVSRMTLGLGSWWLWPETAARPVAGRGRGFP
jgi:hypothetical protein